MLVMQEQLPYKQRLFTTVSHNSSGRTQIKPWTSQSGKLTFQSRLEQSDLRVNQLHYHFSKYRVEVFSRVLH
jgi:hypothetical protein